MFTFDYIKKLKRSALISHDKLLFLTLFSIFLPLISGCASAPKPTQKLVSDDIAELIIRLDPPSRWRYDNAFMVQSLYEKWQVSQNPAHLKWVKNWLDEMLTDEGKIIGFHQKDYNLDMIQPGKLCLAMYKQFGEEKYKRAAETLLVQLENQPKTFNGGFWHKQRYPYQMWLDGLFMYAPFAVQYAEMFQANNWFDVVGYQLTLIAKHTQDTQLYPDDSTRKGLMYHGWDSSAFEDPPKKPQVWADPETGHCPEFWGRAIGWYAMAIVDCLDYLTKDNSYRPQIIKILNDLAEALAYYQDPETHLWWQVVDKGYPREKYPDNYTESSCSAMFAYALGRAAEKGYLDKPDFYLDISRKAFKGLLANKIFYDADGKLAFTDTVKVGSLSSDGSYSYYVEVERPDNDYKGVGALMRAALWYEKSLSEK